MYGYVYLPVGSARPRTSRGAREGRSLSYSNPTPTKLEIDRTGAAPHGDVEQFGTFDGHAGGGLAKRP